MKTHRNGLIIAAIYGKPELMTGKRDTKVTYQDACYRLFRLRRVLLVGSLLPVAGLAIGAWISQTPWILAGLAPICVAAFSFLLLALMLVRFPNSPIEALALPLGMALTLVFVPLIDRQDQFTYLFIMVPGLWIDAAVHMALAWMVLFFALVPALGLLDRLRAGQSTARSSVITDLPPEEAFAALTTQPNSRSDRSRSGPVDENGYFDVTVWYQGSDPETFKPTRQSYDYRMRILESEPLRQVASTVLDCEGVVTTSVCEIRVTPTKNGSLCESREVQDHLSVLARINFWLTDYGADFLQGALDDAAGRDSHALCRQPQRSMLVCLACAMTRSDPAADAD